MQEIRKYLIRLTDPSGCMTLHEYYSVDEETAIRQFSSHFPERDLCRFEILEIAYVSNKGYTRYQVKTPISVIPETLEVIEQ